MPGIAWGRGGRLRAVRLGLVGLGVALAVSLGACGDDDEESCGYVFNDVTTAADCDDLAGEFDCDSDIFNDGNDTCELGGCLICGDFDTDFDGDLDTDGDIDVDD